MAYDSFGSKDSTLEDLKMHKQCMWSLLY